MNNINKLILCFLFINYTLITIASEEYFFNKHQEYYGDQPDTSQQEKITEYDNEKTHKEYGCQDETNSPKEQSHDKPFQYEED